MTEDSENEEEVPPEQEPKSKRKRKRKRKKKDEVKEEEAVVVQVAAPDDDQKTQQVDRTVFVEGIPFHCTEADVREFFVKNGIEDIIEMRLPQWQDSGRLRGYGHVVLESGDSQQAALQLSGQHLQNRYLTIQKAQAPKAQRNDPTSSEPSKTIMLHNLSYNANEETVRQVMEPFGTIADGGIRIVRHSNTQRSKGFGYVEFESIDDAKKVLQQPIVILNRPCRVDYDHGRVRASFRGPDRKLWTNQYGNKRQRP